MDAGDASFPGSVCSVFGDDDFRSTAGLGLNPAPVFIGIPVHAGRATELSVLQGDRLTDHALTERHLVGDTVNDDVGLRLADRRLIEHCLKLDVPIL